MNFFFDAKDLISQLVPRFRSYNFAPSDLVMRPNQKYLDGLSYNVEFTSCRDETRYNKIISAIQASNAGLVCLQETNEVWKDLLEKEFSLMYPYTHHHNPTARPAGGLTFLSRYPIKDISLVDATDTIQGSVFPALIGIFETDLGPVKVANIHLRPPVNLDGSASLETARITGSIRQAEISHLLSKHPDLELLLGDFNEQDESQALRYLTARTTRRRDALAQFVPFYKETHRWPFACGSTLHKRLDHIVYDRSRFQCIGCGVITGYEQGASDHQPVLARFVSAREDCETS